MKSLLNYLLVLMIISKEKKRKKKIQKIYIPVDYFMKKVATKRIECGCMLVLSYVIICSITFMYLSI